jgi:hypothetical protein
MADIFVAEIDDVSRFDFPNDSRLRAEYPFCFTTLRYADQVTRATFRRGVYFGNVRDVEVPRQPRGQITRPGTVRIIEYEIVSKGTAASMGLLTSAVAETPGASTDVALLRCVDIHGEKFTALGEVEAFRTLLASGQASDPSGIRLPNREFPVLRRGWPQAS